MRTNAQKISTATKKTVVGVVVVLNVSLGLESTERVLKLMGREHISEIEAEMIARRKYTSIVGAGGKVEVARIEKYKPIKLGVKDILNSLRMF